LEAPVRRALEPLKTRIALALIYGSVAKHTDAGGSDIDLLVVSSDLTLEDLYAQLSPIERQLGRQVNPTLYTPDEFRKRRRGGNAFLQSVLDGPVIELIGEVDARSAKWG